MKHIITTLCLLIACSAFAQKKISESSAPSGARDAYYRDNSKHSSKDVWREYPDRITIQWKENSKHVYTFAYKKDGAWINRVRKAERSELSKEITNDISSRYPKHKIIELVNEISNDGKFYIVTLKYKKETVKLYYLMSGTFDHEQKQ